MSNRRQLERCGFWRPHVDSKPRPLRATLALCLAVLVSITACSAPDVSVRERIDDHPSFPCYLWWTSSSQVAGLAGVVPWASRFESVSVITYDELFERADAWVPDSDMALMLRNVRAKMPDDSGTDREWQQWEALVVIAVFQWALFHLDVARGAVESSKELREEDREPLLIYVTVLEEYVEDQLALALPVLTANPRIDVTTLGVITGTRASDKLYQAWRDITEDSPFDTEAGIRDAAINVCGPEVYEIGTDS